MDVREATRHTFPFGMPSTDRPPRPATSGRTALFVLGVYPSALHVRWRGPKGTGIQSLAVDVEPEVFWDGADAVERVDRWRREVGWQDDWGSVTATGNGTSGRAVVEQVLRPLGLDPSDVFFTDCIRRFFVKSGEGSQARAMEERYAPFAWKRGLPAARLPPRPTSASAFVRLAVAEDQGALGAQLVQSGATEVVTLGQEAADVFARLAETERVRLRVDAPTYGEPASFRLAAIQGRWTALIHPGQRRPDWAERHTRWMESRVH